MTSPPAQLKHTLKRRHIAMISLGGIIGAGLFVGSSAAIARTGPAAVVSYAMAGLLVFLVMRMIGEMATALPKIGSFTEYTRAALGNWAGFSCGWLYWYFWVIVVAVEAIAGATLIAQWWHIHIWFIALLLLICMMSVNVLSVKSYGEFEYWFSSLKVAAIIAFIVVGLGYVLGVYSGGTPHLGNLTGVGGFMPHGIGSVLGAVPVVIFSIAGAEVATIAAAESADPAKNIASITRSIVVRVLTFYVCSILLIVTIVPWNRIIVGSSPFVAALDQMRVPAAVPIMNALILVAVLSCLNSGLYVASRVLFELSQRGDAPASMVQVNGNSVPLRAILASSIFGFAAIFVSFEAPAGVFKFLIDASGCIMLLVYLLIAVSQVKLRLALPDQIGASRMWFFPILSYAVIASIAAILISMAANAGMRSEVLASAVALAVTLACFAIHSSRRTSASADPEMLNCAEATGNTELGI